MPFPSTVKFRNMQKLENLEADILKRLDRLVRYGPSLLGAKVVVEPVAQQRQSGQRYHVRIELDLPGDTIVVAHTPERRVVLRRSAARSVRKQDEPDQAHTDAGLAVRDAFAAARRRLQDYVRKQRGAVKTHPRRPAPREARTR